MVLDIQCVKDIINDLDRPNVNQKTLERLAIGLILLNGFKEDREILGQEIIDYALSDIPSGERHEIEKQLSAKIKGERTSDDLERTKQANKQYLDELKQFLSSQGIKVTEDYFYIMRRWAKRAKIKIIDDYPLHLALNKNDLNGACDKERKFICLSPDLTTIEKALVLAHELGHYFDPNPHDDQKYNTDYFYHSSEEKKAWIFAGMLFAYINGILSMEKVSKKAQVI